MSKEMHQQIVSICLAVVCLLSTLSASYPVYEDSIIPQDDQDSYGGDQVVVLNRLMNTMMRLSPEERQALPGLVEIEREGLLNKDVIRKKANVMCHFKICNLGRRK